MSDDNEEEVKQQFALHRKQVLAVARQLTNIEFHFAIQSHLVPGDTYRQKFELLARWGYDGIEVSALTCWRAPANCARQRPNSPSK